MARKFPAGREFQANPSPRRLGAPGEKAVVLQPRLAVAQRRTVEAEDVPAGGFEPGLPGRGVPLHRRPETRIEISLARRQHAEFQRAAALLALDHRAVLVLEILGEVAAVLVAAAVDHDNPLL